MPVMLQMIIVSINVPVMDMRPCLTGSLVFAAAAAIGAEPRPASLENIPLDIPFCIATNTEPTIPPVNAFGSNAASIIIAIAAGTSVIFNTITSIPNIK